MIIEIYGDKEKHLYTIFTKWFNLCNLDKTLYYINYDGDGVFEYLEKLHYKNYFFPSDNRVVVHV